jgi:maltooligosyltrehalose trehalohydrolase
MSHETTKVDKSKPRGLRRRPVGAEVQPGGVHFRVWAPAHPRVAVVLGGGATPDNGRPARAIELGHEGDGYFSGFVPEAGVGTRYRYRLGEALCPDPASRFQPEGPHGPSEVVDPGRFDWTDQGWRGPERRGLVLYEVHIGTLTPEGTWQAAARALPSLAELGVTVLEVMPVAEFPGRFGWGYDGVALYAPYHHYGTPDDMRRFVDRAHALGIGVILDVCYSHLGPDGNHLPQFAPDYFTDRYRNAWGEAFNFDGENCGPVRELIVENVAYWVDEFHLDGIRIDATQDLFDASPDHIVRALGRRVREAAGGRRTLVVGENEAQQADLLRSEEEGGFGLDALWTDDFHHAAMVAATGRSEAYYSDYRGTPQEFVSAAKYGFLYQGQWNVRQGKRRGSPAFGLGPGRFVVYLQNHDQLANSVRGERFHALTGPGRYRALTALLLLGPGTPLLFQGQEFAASSPFLYFGDHRADLAEQMHGGRLDFLSQFPSLALHSTQGQIPRSGDPESFRRSKLDPTERERHAWAYALHADLLRLRREDRTFRARRAGGLDGAVLGPEAFVLRDFSVHGDDRLLVVNLGPDLHLDPAPEPLLAPPRGSGWTLLWSSEDPRYGGSGTPLLDSAFESWRIPGHAAVVLAPKPEPPKPEPMHG